MRGYTTEELIFAVEAMEKGGVNKFLAVDGVVYSIKSGETIDLPQEITE